MESADRTVLAQVTADWAGPLTHDERSRPGAMRTRERVGFRDHGEAVRHALGDLGMASTPAGERPAAVGHRIVHGGEVRAPRRGNPRCRPDADVAGRTAPGRGPLRATRADLA